MASHHLLGVEPRVRPHQHLGDRAQPSKPGQRLPYEAARSSASSGPALAQPRVDHLAGLGDHGEHRVVAAGVELRQAQALGQRGGQDQAGVRSWRCGLRSLQEPWIDITTPMGEALFDITVVWAQLERHTISERVRAGMERARAEGKHVGRPRRSTPITEHGGGRGCGRRQTPAC